ncbi:MAG: prepilin peptidase [Bacteroidales bacterium]|nr:prepilin peptidase [Lachnoclostridium sp.]MCM1464865.1 prepilin peptidase [Bacteroidales bacterium]
MWKFVMVLTYLVILSIMDIREKQVPVYLLGAGLLLAIFIGAGERVREEELAGALHLIRVIWKILPGLLFGLLPGIFLLGMAWMSQKAGTGDGVVLMILGLFTDYHICIIVFSASLFLVSLFSICMMALRRAHGKTRLPYIPFLTAAYIGYQICKTEVWRLV